MADLLGDLIDATDDETMVGALLSSATPMLMRPFIGIPEPGSIYGTAESTLSEKAAAYRTAMEERVGRARGSGNGERQALALERLSAHVFAEVAKLQRENLRLVCCDVDGTLLTPEHTVTPKTVEVVLRAMESVTFACCTGRGRFGAYNALGPIGEKLRERNAPGVFLNGLLVYGPDGEIVCEEVLPSAVVLDAAAFAATHELSLVGFTGERIVCSAADQWTDVFETIKEPKAEALHLPWEEIVKAERLNKLILLGEPSTLSSLRSALSGALGETASLTCAIPTMLEVLPAGGSKGKGVRALLERLGVDASEAMAIGDAENDLGMLELCGLSVAMGNAPEDVRRVADFVSGSNEEDGAAAALERHLLGAEGKPNA